MCKTLSQNLFTPLACVHVTTCMKQPSVIPFRPIERESIRSRSEYLLRIYHLRDFRAAAAAAGHSSSEIANTSRSPSSLLPRSLPLSSGLACVSRGFSKWHNRGGVGVNDCSRSPTAPKMPQKYSSSPKKSLPRQNFP